jgi:alpha/beta superfamily hydrolase
MKIYFSHGKESGPWGSKIKRLADIGRHAGCHVDSIDYRDTVDPDLRVERLIAQLKAEIEPIVLVGSSMGGYVSLVAVQEIDAAGMFLMAPALYLPGYQQQSHSPRCGLIEIVHGWSDDVVPVESSIRFAREADCSLHLIRGDHRLNSSLDVVAGLFEDFLSRVMG